MLLRVNQLIGKLNHRREGRRWRAGRCIACALFVLGVGLSLSACGADSASISVDPLLQSHDDGFSCPRGVPAERPSDPARIIRIPKGASVAVICRYSGSAGPDRNDVGSLVRETTLSPPEADALAGRIDDARLRSVDGPSTCPSDDGTRSFVWFRFSKGTSYAFEVKLSGCRSIKPVAPRGRARVLQSSFARYLAHLEAVN